MSEQAGLLRAICDHPDDDTHRLVYADWLDDHGDSAQAEYIRTEVALAKLPEHDPGNVRRRRAIRDRNAAPEARPAAPALPERMRWPNYDGYRRGFPWKLLVYDLDGFLREAPRLFEQAPLLALDIDVRDQPDLSPLFQAPWFERIVRVEFCLGEFGTDTIQKLLDSPHTGRLTELVFQFGGIRGDGLRLLLTSPLAKRLRVLGLRHNFFVEYGAQIGEAFFEIEPLPVLEWLDLEGNRIGEVSLQAMQGRTPALKYLDVSGNSLPPDAFGILASSLSQLESLQLAKTMPGVFGVAVLANSASCLDNLRSLDLKSNKLGPVAMKSLVDGSKFTGLRVIGLRDNPIHDSGAAVLARMPGLVSLDLGKAGLTDKGARALLDSPAMSGLVHLDLRDNVFSPSVVAEIRERFGHFSASDPQHAYARKPRGKKKS